MGLLVDGKWHDLWYDTTSSGGHFIRGESQFRNWITADGSPGQGGEGGFKAEPGRYHLYVSLACPWAHRVRIMRALKGLEEMIPESVVHWFMGENGWTFAEGPGVIPDPIHNARFLYEIYTAAQPDYSGRVTVPVLWDKERRTIVNNESSEIMRMLTRAFDPVGARSGDYYPEPLRTEIDAVNGRVYDNFNNGVYKAGFSTSQAAYDEAVAAVFETLTWLEDRLSRQRYLIGAQVTEADIRLFTTLVRFDEVYHGHFKCNRRRLVDYSNLWAFTREIFQLPGVASTVNMHHIKHHYHESHRTINPTGIVPVGPSPNFTEAHGREALSAC
jgi:putative glutathione S-transferase